MKQYLRWIDTNMTGDRNGIPSFFVHPTDFDALVADLIVCVADTPVDPVAAISLVKGQEAVVVGVATIHMDWNERTREINRKYSMWPTQSDDGGS